MKRGITGHFVATTLPKEPYKSFVPNPLPPKPKLTIEAGLQELYDRALLALGKLNGISALLPDPHLFIYTYVRKEAVLSSQIEGTQSSLSDLLLYESKEAPGVPLGDVQEVSTYVAAMNHGFDFLKDNYPITLRLIREMHDILLSEGRGSRKERGEFRRSQNWVGGSRPGNAAYVPPPHDMVLNCMGDLENFLNDKPHKTPALLKAALAHVQFETIHPFLDGNGRLGRLLITLVLCSEGVLTDALLYLSLFFKNNRQKYYDLLQTVRLEGDWEGWLEFFLTGVIETSESAAKTVNILLKLFEGDIEKIKSIGKSAGSVMRAHRELQRNPILSVNEATQRMKMSYPATAKAFANMVKLGIAREITGRQRNRLFVYDEYLKIMEKGTEPAR